MKIVCHTALILLLIQTQIKAQTFTEVINQTDVTRLEKILSADSLNGRKTFTKGIQKAAGIISTYFKEAGLKTWPGTHAYRQSFEMIVTRPVDVSINAGGRTLSPERILERSTEKEIDWTDQSPVKIDSIVNMATFGTKIREYLHPVQNTVVWVDSGLKKRFVSLKRYLEGQKSFDGTPTVLFILSDRPYPRFHIRIKNALVTKKAENIVGFLPGKSQPEEYVIFSAHYDHLGTDGSLPGDTIYNGANDDASGTTAVIELAKYFSKKADNQRSLIFVTFSGEEEGGYGSRYFSEQLDPEKIIAMLNIEMIGTSSKWGENSAYITGFEKSSLGSILQQNLKGTGFRFHPDPYPKQHLFYRSDNATLARLGVPAHTISTSKMDNEPHYHKVSDEISTLDLKNMTKIIRSIALSAKSLISGKDTPTRVDPGQLE